MGSLYLWGPSIQEMGGNVVIGRSIYGVVVIDGSLYSQFYGICSFLYRWFDYTPFGTPIGSTRIIPVKTPLKQVQVWPFCSVVSLCQAVLTPYQNELCIWINCHTRIMCIRESKYAWEFALCRICSETGTSMTIWWSCPECKYAHQHLLHKWTCFSMSRALVLDRIWYRLQQSHGHLLTPMCM